MGCFLRKLAYTIFDQGVCRTSSRELRYTTFRQGLCRISNKELGHTMCGQEVYHISNRELGYTMFDQGVCCTSVFCMWCFPGSRTPHYGDPSRTPVHSTAWDPTQPNTPARWVVCPQSSTEIKLSIYDYCCQCHKGLQPWFNKCSVFVCLWSFVVCSVLVCVGKVVCTDNSYA